MEANKVSPINKRFPFPANVTKNLFNLLSIWLGAFACNCDHFRKFCKSLTSGWWFANFLFCSPNVLHGLIRLVNQKKVLSFVTTLIHHCITHSVQVSPSGRTLSIAGTNTLAGSCGTLLGAFHSLSHIFRVPLGDAVAMLSENPARYNCGYWRIGVMLSSCLKIQN